MTLVQHKHQKHTDGQKNTDRNRYLGNGIPIHKIIAKGVGEEQQAQTYQ